MNASIASARPPDLEALLREAVQAIGGFEIHVEPTGDGYCVYVERTDEGGDVQIFDGPSLEAALHAVIDQEETPDA